MKLDLKKLRKETPIKDLLKFSIINLDKPQGPTSHSISDYVKTSLKLNKTSHLGTLDPQVTGVLPITLGRACKLMEVLLGSDKTYVGIMTLHSDISLEELNQHIKKFIGKIKQLPPVKSAVARREREREIKTFKILEMSGREVLFETQVEAGTYIRKLIHDIGLEIGGAQMSELRRIKASIFTEYDDFANMYEFEEAIRDFKKGNEEKLRNMLFPAEYVLSKAIPIIQLNPKSLKQALTGKPLTKSDLLENLPNEEIFAVFLKKKLIQVVKKVNEGDIITRPLFVYN